MIRCPRFAQLDQRPLRQPTHLPSPRLYFLYIDLYMYSVPCHAVSSALQRFSSTCPCACSVLAGTWEAHMASINGVISTPPEPWANKWPNLNPK